MSDSVLQDLVVRMATDPEFAHQVKTAPEITLGAFELTPEEVTQLTSLGADVGAGTTGLAARQSKSSLLFMGAHHQVAHDPGLAQAGHVNLHDAGALHHGPGGSGEHVHADGGDDPIMIGTVKHDEFGSGGHAHADGGDDPIMIGTVKHDEFGSGGHAHADGGDDPIMIGTIKHDVFTGGVHPGDGGDVELHGSGPIE